jgi:hypothetical protein
VIKATIVLLVAQLLIPRLRRRSAAERHLLWTASLVTAALLPVLSLLLPSWQPKAHAASPMILHPARFGLGHNQSPDILDRAAESTTT